MTTDTDSPVVQRIRQMMDTLDLNQVQMAIYLGVPHSTFVNWMQGTRQPNAVVVRLLDVLGTIKTFAPALHNTLLPPRRN